MNTTNTFELHAGAVKCNEKSYIFIGPSLEGKTTLVSFLSENGCEYINDDHVMIDLSTLMIIPNVSPMHLREKSLSILSEYGCNIKGEKLKINNCFRIVYTPQKVSYDSLIIEKIYFIKRDEQHNYIENLSKTDAIKLLMQNLFSPDAINLESLTCAIKFANKCQRLIYSDMTYVLNLLLKEG